MKTTKAFAAALALLVAVAACRAQQSAPHMFDGVPLGSPAYAAMQRLRAAGLVNGYPNGYFAGRRTLTRFEFAVAFDRLLQRAGSRDHTVSFIWLGRRPTRQDMADARLLADEFRIQLRSLDETDAGIRSALDNLAGMAGIPGGSPFPDVPRDHWAFAAVERLRQRGILRGYPPARSTVPPLTLYPGRMNSPQIPRWPDVMVAGTPFRYLLGRDPAGADAGR